MFHNQLTSHVCKYCCCLSSRKIVVVIVVDVLVFHLRLGNYGSASRMLLWLLFGCSTRNLFFFDGTELVVLMVVIAVIIVASLIVANVNVEVTWRQMSTPSR